MAYCAQADLVDRFGMEELIQLTDDARLGVIGSAALNRAITDASAEIDTYLRARYPLPLLSTPPEILSVACDIARYRLSDQLAPEIVKERYDAARKLLADLSTGRAVLPDSVVSATDSPQTAGIAAYSRTLRMDTTLEALI